MCQSMVFSQPANGFYSIACIKGLKQIFTGVEINLINRFVRTTKWIYREKDKNYILGVKNEKKITWEVGTRFSKCLQKPSICCCIYVEVRDRQAF